MHTHTHTNTTTKNHAHARTHTPVHTHTPMHKCLHVMPARTCTIPPPHTHTHLRTHTHTYAHPITHACTHNCTCMHTCTYTTHTQTVVDEIVLYCVFQADFRWRHFIFFYSTVLSLFLSEVMHSTEKFLFLAFKLWRRSEYFF